MVWDENGVRKYERWYETATGGFAFQTERRLVERLISGWQRRGCTLLEIGCGPGFFLKAFWETGFEVSGLDENPYMLAAARRRLGPKASFHVGQAGHLPFEDNEFDYASLITVLEFTSEPARILLEAARVAKKGLLVGYLNRRSLYYLEKGRVKPDAPKPGSLRLAHWFTPCEMRRLVRSCLGARPMQGGSVLPGPFWTWRDGLPWRWINAPVLPLGLGAFCALRIDLEGDEAMTPLMAFETEPKPTG